MYSADSIPSALGPVCTLKRTLRCLLALLVAAAIGGGTPAAAQTTEHTVMGPQGNVLLRVMDQGGMLAPGTFGTGTVPASGPGTRLMWIPSKAAFRAGRVGRGLSDGSEWDASRVGPYSVAFGVDTQAQGRGAVALGRETTARGGQAFTMGYRTTASGLRSSAFGDLTMARGNFSTALGLHTTARSVASVAFGRWNVRSGAPSSWESTDPLLVAGNGSGPADRSNALMLQKNGDLTIAGTLTEHSDRRLKTNVRSLGPVGTALDRLRPVRFRFKDGTGHPASPQVGLLAQDVQAEFPSLVRKGADGFLSLAYPKLTAVLVKGLQEQRARIDSLERRVQRLERLEEKQDRLAEQVATLAAQETGPQSTLLGLDGRAAGTGVLLLVFGGLLGAALARR